MSALEVPDLLELGSNESWSDEEDSDEDVHQSFEQQVICMFSDDLYSSAKEYFNHLKETQNFDIWNLVHVDLKLDFFGYVKLINFLRSNFKNCIPPTAEKLEDLRDVWNDKKYLKPVIPDDPLLQFMIDEDDVENCNSQEILVAVNDSFAHSDQHETGKSNTMPSEELLKQLAVYKAKTKVLETKLAVAYTTIDKMKEFMNDVILTSDTGMYRPVAACRKKNNEMEEELFEDSGYFGTYSHHDIHAEMLQDKVRTEAYENAILLNLDTFANKIVLDVGCGSGILSMFAAKAGAKHVYGVDMSDIAYQAMDIIKENNLDDKITIIKGCIEEVDLPVSKVDIIISEWMGYFLLYESMLDSVLHASDKWLSQDGLILPDECKISLVAIHDEKLLKSQVQFWDNVYGFRMSCLKKSASSEALVQVISADAVISDSFVVAEFNIQCIKPNQLNYKSDFTVKVTKSGLCSAVGAYFDVSFKNGLAHPISFTTSPFGPCTHWKQTIFFLEKPVAVKEGDKISGNIDCHKNPQDPRSLVVHLDFAGMKQTYTVS